MRTDPYGLIDAWDVLFTQDSIDDQNLSKGKKIPRSGGQYGI
jgi:hypothetical protein